MSQEIFFRGLFSVPVALAFAWVVFSRNDDEIGSEESDSDHQKYLPYISGSLLPGFLLAVTILTCFVYGSQAAMEMVLSMCFSIFLHICLFYLVLLLILPILRKHTMLWLMPNYLYLIHQSYMDLPSPLLVITAPGKLVWIIMGIWFVGFAGIMLWKTIGHLLFRRRILKNSRPVTDQLVLTVWQEQLLDARFRKPKFKLVTSPDVSTPLTIGLSSRSTRVVLPEKTYTREELELILRHELVHIGRGDACNKFFMVFCAAMCWFNPLMWVAMRKSADDMELSCDETVLLGTDDVTRKQYAVLLLNTAGDESGFTTCLSATANALRYRLQNITKPGKRSNGAVIVGVTFFLLSMTSGYIALAYDGSNGHQMLYQYDDLSVYTIRHVSIHDVKHDDNFSTTYETVDEIALHEYLAGLTLYELTGNYSFSDSQRYYHYLMDTPAGTQVITLYDNVIKLVRLYQSDLPAEYFYITEGIDWNYIDSLIIPEPALNIQLYETGNAFGNLPAYVNYLWKTEDGDRRLIRDGAYPEGEYHGLFTGEPYPRQATFTFSQEPDDNFTVQVESWDYSTSYTVSLPAVQDGQTMDLPDYPAHYTVNARFQNEDGTLYEIEFWFNIGAISSN